MNAWSMSFTKALFYGDFFCPAYEVFILNVELTAKKKDTSGAPSDGLIVKTGDTIVYKAVFSPSSLSDTLQDNDYKWEYCQLNHDGSWTDWAEFGQGQGRTFEHVTDQGGIYRVRVTILDVLTTELLRKQDEPCSFAKAGQFDAIGVADTQVQIDIRRAARDFLCSSHYDPDRTVPAEYGFPDYDTTGNSIIRCNIFVAHRGVQAGANVPAINGYFNEYPPLANEWGGIEDTSAWPGFQTEIEDWTLLSTSTKPQPGFIVADPELGDAGHCAITDYDGEGIGAGQSFSVSKKHLFYKSDDVRIRKYEP